MLLDLRFILRALAKTPGFTALLVLILALAVGLCGASFSLVKAFILAELPFPDPDRLIAPGFRDRNGGWPGVSVAEFLDLRREQTVCVDLCAYCTEDLPLIPPAGDPERLSSGRISASAVSALRLQAQVGRWFNEADDHKGSPWTVVLSDRVWRRLFAADRGVIGRVVRIDATDFQIIGVAYPRFVFPYEEDFWLPWQFPATDTTARDARYIDLFGRLKPGVTLEQARAEFSLLVQRMAAADPLAYEKVRFETVSLRDRLVPRVYGMIQRMSWGSAFVLLIACANIANLMLVRGAARQHEIAIRIALGAGRGDVIRTLLLEALLLGLAGAIGGCGIAIVLVNAFHGILMTWGWIIPSFLVFKVDGLAVAALVVLSVATTVIAALVPALRVARTNPQMWLKDGGRGARGVAMGRFMHGLVVAEIAAATALLGCLGLFVRSALNTHAAPLGFDPAGVASGRFLISGGDDRSAASREQFGRQLMERLQAQPDVAVAALSWDAMFDSQRSNLIADAREPRTASSAVVHVTGGYFKLLSIPLLQGRTFDERDHVTAERVAIVNAYLAELLWPGESPLGRRFKLPRAPATPDEPWRIVVGIVAPSQQGRYNDTRTPQAFLPWSQLNHNSAIAWVKAQSGKGDALIGALKNAMREVDPQVPYFWSRTLESEVNRARAIRRVWLPAYMVIGAVALLLAAAGLYGVVSYGVRRRTAEFGVRMALGAMPKHVLKLVVRQVAVQVMIGFMIGGFLAYALGRQLTSQLYQVPAHDGVTLFAVAITLAVAATLASLVPARRALRVDPVVALRQE